MSKLRTAKVLIQKAVRDFSRTNAGKGLKQGAQYVGKGIKTTANTIFTPIKKAHQAQGAGNFFNSTEKYDKGVLASLLGGFIAPWAASGVILACEVLNNKNPEKDIRNVLIASKLIDAGLGCFAGLLLGGPIGAAVGLVAGAAIPKDFVLGSLFGASDEFQGVRKELKAERQARRTERKEKRQAERNADKQAALDSIKKEIKRMEPGNGAFKPDTVSTEVKKDTVAAADTVKPEIKKDTVVVADTVKSEVKKDTVAVADTANLEVKKDTVVAKDTVKTEPIKLEKQEEKTEEVVVKTEKIDKTNFWNGELNEIDVETVKVNRGDCLWNIAKRELQKANQGKTITNAQIVKQVIEFGRLNPELFGENPSYKDLDFIKEGVTLRLSA